VNLFKWIISKFHKQDKKDKQDRHYRVQMFKECIRIHPKDEARKIKDIEQTAFKLFMMAHQTQEKMRKEK
jgi:hypothetical protein